MVTLLLVILFIVLIFSALVSMGSNEGTLGISNAIIYTTTLAGLILILIFK